MSHPNSQPLYGFRESELFERDRARLVAEGVTEQEIDSHLFAIQDSIGPDPYQEPWSRPLRTAANPGTRTAVSDATQAEPNALLVLFRVDEDEKMIVLWRMRKRDD